MVEVAMIIICFTLVQLLFVGVFAVGVWFGKSKSKQETVATTNSNDVSEAEKKRLEEIKKQEQAFTQLMGYNIETAYGMRGSDDKNDRK